jgi:hypothetical protein
MARKKTSIYVDKEIWEEFKKHATSRRMDVSDLLEDIMKEELLNYLDDALSNIAGSEDYQIDFEPVEPKEIVSTLIREMRDERAAGLSR